MSGEIVATERISVANLVSGMRTRQGHWSVVTLHPDTLMKSGVWQTFSAGPKFPPEVRQLLVHEFRADFTNVKGSDARCSLPPDQLQVFEAWLLASLKRVEGLDESGTQPTRHDKEIWNPYPEFLERLTAEYWHGRESPLTADEVSQLQLRTVAFMKQPQPYDTEDRGGRGATHRYFRQMCIHGESRIMAKLIGSGLFQFIQPGDAGRTEGGRQSARSSDGRWLLNNVGVEGDPTFMELDRKGRLVLT